MKRTLPTLVTSLCVLAASSHALAKPKSAATAPATAPATTPAPEPARPKPDAAAKKEAGERFKHGTELYSDGEYSVALAEFERAYALVPDYRVLYNIGQVNIQLGQYARALVTLKEYVTRGAGELSADRIKSVQGDLDMLAGRTAAIVLEVEPEGVEVTIDGKIVGTTPVADPVVVDVGERRIDLKRAGFVAQGQTLSLAGGDRYVAQFKLVPESTASDRPRSDQPVALFPPKSAASKPKPIVYAGYATTGALVAGAVVTGVLGLTAAGDLKDLKDTRGVTEGELDDARDKAKLRFQISEILGAAALLTGAVTVYLHVSGSSKERSRTASANNVWVKVAPTQVTLGMNPSFLQ
jgi:hypothetical protein